MGKRLQIQAHSADDREAVARLARSRTAQARQVERAKVVLAALDGEGVGAIAARVQLSPATVYLWLHRYEQQGLAGLADQPRRGRPPTSPREQVSTIIATALTDPQTLGQAYSAWTLDRLVAYLAEHQGIAMKRSRLDELLLAEGLRWRKQETWFGERVDPECAEKRGRSSSSTPPPLPAASSSVSTRWVRKRPRAGRASGCS
ncbi:MAG TPA: helix-turn-helix domain-containing protein [Ktedonobacterales bacterium]|nr:helix-turn-helix domain-containing protein [Ktedonobacterales bacterium]